ncbi:hypothetical protein SHLO109777_11765 [Shewanella loihica]|uniref:Uncharacterized protein n=1 Tax=Shewanella loihica (strain ATCC BAA-1088 / PV-4) TaxID=323850 RepID=A3QCA9_SHELP|nr:hypothetical protein [Shewanella loihica]ABO23107.1 hypothetical protein Shew_1237 [Shewanella loihica PV-4]
MRISPAAAYQRWTRQLPSDKAAMTKSRGDDHHRQLVSAAELTQDRVTLSPLALKLSALDQSALNHNTFNHSSLNHSSLDLRTHEKAAQRDAA